MVVVSHQQRAPSGSLLFLLSAQVTSRGCWGFLPFLKEAVMPRYDLRIPTPEPAPPPIQEPPEPPENPDVPVREPEPDEPNQI